MLTHTVENGNGLPSSIATVGGSPTVSVNTIRLNGDLASVYVKLATATTTFDVTFTDNKGREVLFYDNEVGILRDRLNLPVEGIYTLKVDADVAEAVTILLKIKEKNV